MKYLFGFTFLSLLIRHTVFAQADTTFSPLTVTIKLEKEYEIMRPKNDFDWEIAKGNCCIATDSAKQKRYDISIELKNNSSKPTFIWLMSCSWQDNFIINNDYIHKTGCTCDKNIPHLVAIQQGAIKKYKMIASKSLKFDYPYTIYNLFQQVETTKLGLIVIDDFFDPKLDPIIGYHLAMEDKSKQKIIWSNPLFLLKEKELHKWGNAADPKQ